MQMAGAWRQHPQSRLVSHTVGWQMAGQSWPFESADLPGESNWSLLGTGKTTWQHEPTVAFSMRPAPGRTATDDLH